MTITLRVTAADQVVFPVPYNTETSKKVPLPPSEAVKKISLPPGFEVTLVAGEPDVQQAIAMKRAP